MKPGNWSTRFLSVLASLLLIAALAACSSSSSSDDSSPGPGPGPGPGSGTSDSEFPGESSEATLDDDINPELAENFIWMVKEFDNMFEDIMNLMGTDTMLDGVSIEGDESGDPRETTVTFSGYRPARDVCVNSGEAQLKAGGFGTYDDGPTWVSMNFVEVSVAHDCDLPDEYTVVHEGEVYGARLSADRHSLTMNVDTQWEGKFYRLEGVEVVHYNAGSHVETTLTGIYHDHDHGHVTASTEEVIFSDDSGPYAGIIKLAAANGYLEIHFTEDGMDISFIQQ